MTDPAADPLPTPAALGVARAAHAPGVSPYPWQLALADARVVLVAPAGPAVVLPGGGDALAPDGPFRVPFGLVPPAVLAAARDALRRAARDEVGELLAGRRQIAPVWGVDDVIAVRPDLSDEQAWAVLQAVGRTHDPDAGVTWRVLQDAAAGLFGPAPDDT